MWKVPLREVYCDSLSGMLKQALWCHVVVRVFPGAVDLATDALRNEYRKNPLLLWEQYEGIFDKLHRDATGA